MTKQELEAENAELKQRLQELYSRCVRAEQDVRQSDPYRVLQKQLEEERQYSKMLKERLDAVTGK